MKRKRSRNIHIHNTLRQGYEAKVIGESLKRAGFFGGAFEESTRFLEEFEPLDVTPEGIGRDLIAP